tara:strand:- start:8762 stop:9670 length:909 start_codon:yes stop_codon:yes gene_type:complete
MSRAFWYKFLLAVFLIALAVIQFIPPAPVQLPAELPVAERESARLLGFEGIHNFRDLGGYTTEDGRRVAWGKLYRSGHFATATRSDLQQLERLRLDTLIDFRSVGEREEEPSRVPEDAPFTQLSIPTLDAGNDAMVSELRERIESGDLEGFDADAFMLQANRQFADEFTPQYRQFMHAVLRAEGRPVAWQCTAGKDRTGFAAAILLRILGVSDEQIIEDYLASREPALDARSRELMLLRVFKGEAAAATVATMLGVDSRWLQAGFDEIDARWGSFDAYVRDGLALSTADVQTLRRQLLAGAG